MHAPRQTRTIEIIARQSLRLLIINALQQVFQTAQEQVGFAQRLRVGVGQQIQRFNRRQRRQQRPALQRRLTSAANQLEDLHNKFDFANTTGAELDVVFQPPTAYFAGDHPFHVTQRLDHAEINVTAEHKRPQHRAQLAGIDPVVVPHDPRFNHRVAFPVAPLLLVIIFQRRKAQHQRTAVAEWA